MFSEASAARFMKSLVEVMMPSTFSGSIAVTISSALAMMPSRREERRLAVSDSSATLSRKFLMPSAFSASAPVKASTFLVVLVTELLVLGEEGVETLGDR